MFFDENASFVDETAKTDNIYTISQITGLIKTMLQGAFPNVVLKGEISNLRPNSTGHLYFVLKDDKAQINAVMFKSSAARLSFTPKDGMLVQVKGSITVYEARGNYQIIINSMTKAGLGDIMEMLEERKRKLAQEGLFDESRKKILPYFPRTVGVVTSPTGAALQDILNITKRRNDKVNVVILPAIVQGDGAAVTVVKQIKTANKYKLCDVLIVGRGGGSLEDLLPFSDEEVVRAIAESEIPVISSVGHEIDWALSDFAADKRAPTPSAAAEIAVPLKSDIENLIQECSRELQNAINTKLQKLRLMLSAFKGENMELQFRSIEQPLLTRFENAKNQILQSMQDIIESRRSVIKECSQTLENCNPQTIFDRGYSMVTDSKTGQVIRDTSNIEKGTVVTIRPSKGSMNAAVI